MDAARDIEKYLTEAWDLGATDILISTGLPPYIRLKGELSAMEWTEPLTAQDTRALVNHLLNPELLDIFREQKDVDFSWSWGDRARVRGSAYTQQGNISIALRIIPATVRTMAELGLPDVMYDISKFSKGFVLVCGPTGSGKSTTLAAIINEINVRGGSHILTIEDPVEYIHPPKGCVVSQREVGTDTPSFTRALRSALREDPDVLLVGEMRDEESIEIALTMAETGHLVFGTLHTNDAPSAIDRVIDVFDSGEQAQIRTQLTGSLSAIVAQRLLPRIEGGLVATYEVLIANHAVRAQIRERRTSQLPNIMLTSAESGMMLMEKHLFGLVTTGVITARTAPPSSGLMDRRSGTSTTKN
jgi:twitching motility protein PilT